MSSRAEGGVRRGDGTFVRTSAATAPDEARNVEKGRIRIFLGPRLNVIFHGAEGCLLLLRPGQRVLES